MNFRVCKVLNNNSVISRDEEDNEIIVTGKGIGYGKQPGMLIDESEVLKVYEPRSKEFIRRFKMLVSEIPDSCFLEAEKIRSLAEKELGQELSDNVILALADHISFVISQYQENKPRTILMNTEFQKIYAEEYRVAIQAVKMIEKDYNIKVSEGEPSAITFHLVNSEINNSSNDAILIAKFVEDILEIIRKTLNLRDDEEKIDYSRLIIHLKFFVRRILSNETEEENDMTQLLLNADEGAYEGIHQCLYEIKEYIFKTYDYEISETERFYLLIHIARILQ